jgi:hypothetical protein
MKAGGKRTLIATIFMPVSALKMEATCLGSKNYTLN